MDTMKIIALTFSLLAFSFTNAKALEIDYNFKNPEECANVNHAEYTDIMMVNQAKLAEIVKQSDVLTFYNAWSAAIDTPYDGDGSDVDTFFVFKAKCSSVAIHLCCEVGKPILIRSKCGEWLMKGCSRY